MADPYGHLLVREHFDWWEDVENDIAIKAKAIPPISTVSKLGLKDDINRNTKPIPKPSTVPITAPKLDEKYARLLVREQFDWCEDVENGIAMKTKALSLDTKTPTADTKDLATASTFPVTANIMNGGDVQRPIITQYNCQGDVDNDVVIKAKSLYMETHIPTTGTNDQASTSTATKLDDEYAQPPVREHDNWLEHFENDTTLNTKAVAIDTEITTIDIGDLDTSSTGSATIKELGDENIQVPFDYDRSEDAKSESTVDTEDLDVTSIGTATARKLDDEGIQHLVSECDNWSERPVSGHDDCLENAGNNIAMDTEDLHLNHELHDTTNGPIIAIQLEDEESKQAVIKDDNWSEDATNDITMDTEDLNTNNEPIATTDGLDTAVKSEDLHDHLHHKISASADDVEANIAMDNKHSTGSNEPLATGDDLVTVAELDDSHAHPLHPETSHLSDDAESTLAMDHHPELNAATKSSDEIADSPQPVESSQLLDVPKSNSSPVSVQTPQPDESAVPDGDVDEYEYRTLIGSEDEDIHHWNWFGRAMYAPTATPPAVSLAFMQVRPKVPKGRDELRVISILNRALHQIDPVILRVDRGNEGVLQMHGSEMIEVCDGNTYTHYSLHGNWMSDDFSMRRMIVPDSGAPVGRGYAISRGQFVIGNGIFENGPLISRYEWMDWRDQLVAAAQEPSRSPRKLTWNPTPSCFKIESMASKKPSPPSHIPSYSFAPLEIMSFIIQKAWATERKVARTFISLPLGVMGPMIKKAPVLKTVPHPPLPFPIGIMGNTTNKAWATAKNDFRKAFVFSVGIIKNAWEFIKAAFHPHTVMPEVVSFLSG